MADNEVIFGITSKGKPCVLHKQYEFIKHRVYANGNIQWRCKRYQSCKCRARLTTRNHEITGDCDPQHNHDGNKETMAARQAVAEMKERMGEISATTTAVIGSVCMELQPDVLTALPKKTSLKRTLQRKRQKLRSASEISVYLHGNMMFEPDAIPNQLLREGKPVVLTGLLSSWKASKWTPESLIEVFQERPLKFRIGKQSTEVQWENECEYVTASISEFNEWVNGECQSDNALSCFDQDTHWCYADYKRMAEMFEDQPQFLKDVDWSVLGFKNYGGEKSTFWLGSKGSNTVCHYDTYGCNLVAQLYGKKRWIMFPPSDTPYMYATRVPYEESSVFSRVSIRSPDLSKFPKFQRVTPYVVTLEPGDVLFVPSKWWHFVESLETSISVNCWVEMASDDAERLREAIARTMIFSLMSENDSVDNWLNPTEDFTSSSQNLEYVRLALSALAEAGSVRVTNSVSRKRKRESSPSNDLEEPERKTLAKEDRTYECLSSVNASKQFDDAALSQHGIRVLKVDSVSWTKYRQLLGVESAAEYGCVDSKNIKTENNSQKGFELKKETTSDSEGSVYSAHDGMFSVDDAVTSNVICPSDISKYQITALDLADVFLDPEVVDLICQKLTKKFHISLPR